MNNTSETKSNPNVRNAISLNSNFLNNYKPSKIQLQELKWKYTTRRKSLPITNDEKLGFSEEIVSKQISRRKSESDLDLDLDTYNVNALQTEISKHSKKGLKKAKKCKKHKCRNSDMKKDKLRKLRRMTMKELVGLLIEDLDNTNKIEDCEFYGKEIFDVVNDLGERLKLLLVDNRKNETDYFISGKYAKRCDSIVKIKNKKIICSKKNLKSFLFSFTSLNFPVTNGLKEKPDSETEEVSQEKVIQILSFLHFFKIIQDDSFLKENSYFDFIINYVNKDKKFNKLIANHKNSLDSDSTRKKSISTDTIFSEDAFIKYLHKFFKSNKEIENIQEDIYLTFYRSQVRKDEKIFKIYTQIVKKDSNESKSESQVKKSTKKKDSTKENDTKARKVEDKNFPDRKNEKPKVNAFQLMMDARHRSIGRNSPGKEKEEVVEDKTNTSEIKEKLHKRKLLFTEWANEKSNTSEKKIKEQAREEYIEDVLEKRAKRLKLMLKIDMSDNSKTENQNGNLSTDNIDESSKIEETKNTPSRWNLRIRPPRKSELSINTSKEDDDVLIVDDDDTPRKKLKAYKSVNEITKNKTPLKLAPLFVTKKTVCKPKIDPTVLEARRKFLHSGMPTEVKIKQEDKNNCEQEYEPFPLVSHIMQRPQNEDTEENNIWYLNKPKFKNPLLPFEELVPNKLKFNNFNSITKSKIDQQPHIITISEKTLRQKSILKEMKSANSTFPFLAIYRQFKEKLEKLQLNFNSSYGKMDDGNSLIDPSYMQWTEKYKPDSFQGIIGNSPCVTELQKWLQNWMADQEKKKIKSNDFETSDSDTNDSSLTKASTLVLVGPSGIGKTASVYALAKELGMIILEINASTQRTGKKILNAIQEATQSHRVTKTLSGDLLEEKQIKINKSQEKSSDDKMSLILIEDIDIVFVETEDGFLSALNSLLVSSKRPFILTSSNPESKITQKYTTQYKTLEFKPISTKVLVPWFRTLCLVEGFVVSEEKVFDLINLNQSDIRRTMLDLQFWTRCVGGRINFIIKNDQDTTAIDSTSIYPALTLHDNYKLKESMYDIHLWRNIPTLMNLKSFNYLSNDSYIEKENDSNFLKNGEIENLTAEKKSYKERKGVDLLAEIYDSLTIADLFLNSSENIVQNPVLSSWRTNFTKFGDSLSLKDNKSLYLSSQENLQEINSVMLDLSINLTSNIFTDNETSRSTIPANYLIEEKRYQKKIQTPDKIVFNEFSLQSLLPPSNNVDYLFGLRTINRSEVDRAVSNTKRKNRFCHYLKTLGIHFNDQQSEIFNNCFMKVDQNKTSEL